MASSLPAPAAYEQRPVPCVDSAAAGITCSVLLLPPGWLRLGYVAGKRCRAALPLLSATLPDPLAASSAVWFAVCATHRGPFGWGPASGPGTLAICSGSLRRAELRLASFLRTADTWHRALRAGSADGWACHFVPTWVAQLTFGGVACWPSYSLARRPVPAQLLVTHLPAASNASMYCCRAVQLLLPPRQCIAAFLAASAPTGSPCVQH